jgi:hypothetical protein
MLINADKIMKGNLQRLISIIAIPALTVCVGLNHPASAKPSSYQITCNSITISGNRISASCRQINGLYNNTSLVLLGIENINGVLRVTDPSKVSNYQLTCSKIRIRGDMIKATCLTRNQLPHKTSLTLQGIENIDGVLKYTATP